MSAPQDHLGLAEVLREEYAHLHPQAPPASIGASPADLPTMQRAMREAGHVALCLSGGGIRSASFALGVIQRLADTRVLDRVDYLSTVSGGGYTGGWLSAWLIHAAAQPTSPPVFDQLRGAGRDPAQPEPGPVTQVRRFSRYLAPQSGVLSADVWTLLVTVARNMLLNWLILLPMLAALLLVPRIYVQLVRLADSAVPAWWWTAAGLAATLLVIAALHVRRDLPSLGDARRPAATFLRWCLLPLVAAQVLLSLGWAWRDHAGLVPELLTMLSLAALIAGVPWLLARARRQAGTARLRMWLAAVVCGSVTALAVLAARQALAAEMLDAPVFGARIYAALDVPAALLLIALGGMVFTGIASRDMSDDDREWWARAIAWTVIAAAVWAIVSVVVLFSLPGVERLRHLHAIGYHDGWGQFVLTLVTLLLGNAATDAGRRLDRTRRGRRSWLPRAAFAFAAPAFALCLFVLLAVGTEDLLDLVAGRAWFDGLGPYRPLAEVQALALLLLAFGLLMDVLVNINRFSLHGMYRDRITRTFLGASRREEERRPHPFTGLDGRDNVPLHALPVRPLHIINATLNQTSSTRAGWQERRAQPFVFSPLHCGAAADAIGFRRSEAYAGGITLGSALAISGAAVSSSMGDRSSPPLTFLMTMFNARLGVWLGNPNNDRTWRRAEPVFGAGALFNELVGRETADRGYVYLSDGEHFENLALYEMVRRRCRTIIVSDAGCDPAYAFEDLANAIRLVRLDFGVPIEFPDGIEALRPDESGLARAHHAVAAVRYSVVDGSPPEQDGRLIYLKANLTGEEPVDVMNYRVSHPDFPHQSTVDQFFGEADFEAYRALGWRAAAGVRPG